MNIIITGAANGLGYALAHFFANNNHHVYMLDRQKPKLLQKNQTFFKVDIINPKQLQTIAKKISKKIDILINNAGIMKRGTLKEISIEDMNRLIDVNAKGYVWVTKIFLPLCKKDAKIVFVSSRHAKTLPKDPGIYALTKKINADTAQLFQKTYPKLDIRTLYLGPIDTQIAYLNQTKKQIKQKQPQPTEKTAHKIMQFLETDKKELIYREKSKKYYSK